MVSTERPSAEMVGPAVDPAALTLIADPVWIFDLDCSRIVWANSAAISLWRADNLDALRSRDMTAKSDIAKSRLRGYAERFAAGRTVEAVWTLMPDNKPVTVRCRCRGIALTDGRIAMLVHAVADEADGRTDAVDRAEELREARDQLTQAEARYRTFAEVGSDWLWETDQTHRFTYYSFGSGRHHAYDPGDLNRITRMELIARIGADPDTPETRAKWRQHEQDLDAHRPFRDLQYAYRRPDGAVCHASISGDPVFDRYGSFKGYRGIGRDLTEAVRRDGRERELQRERDAAVSANAVMNQFLAAMSHELRTPLNAIIGFSEIISSQLYGPVGNGQYLEYAGDIHNSAQHLLSIVEHLLDLSRLELVDRSARLQRVPAEALSSELGSMVRVLAAQRRVRLDIDLPEPGYELTIDRRGIKQVALNLLSNAIKFTDAGGMVSLRIAPAGQGWSEIVVRDSGCGIDEAQMSRVKEPFRSANPHVAHPNAGAGLGLWISNRIVAIHGGELTLDSTVGEGTTATVRLPQQKV